MKTTTLLKSAAALTMAAIINTLSATPAQAALSDCPSGYICLWSKPNYTGTLQKISTTGAYKSIGLSIVESIYNNRSKRTWLHAAADGSGSYQCLEPAARFSNLTGWHNQAKAVYLTTVAEC